MTTMNGMIRRIGADEVTDDRLFASAFEGRVRVSPERAQRWLETRNTNNRPIVRSGVADIVNEISRGHWRDDHPSPILFDREGTLIDGQHRLMAIVEAGIPVVVRVETQRDPTLRHYIDTGKRKKLSDRVRVCEDNRVNAAAVSIATYFEGGTRMRACDTFLAAFDPHRESILWAARWMVEQNHVKRITGSAVAAALAKMYEVSPEMAVKFSSSLRQADGPVQPARILRDWLLTRSSGSRGGGQFNEEHERALAACYAHLCGREVKALKRLKAIPDYDRAA